MSWPTGALAPRRKGVGQFGPWQLWSKLGKLWEYPHASSSRAHKMVGIGGAGWQEWRPNDPMDQKRQTRRGIRLKCDESCEITME